MYDLPGASVRQLVELVGRWNVPADALLAGLPITLAALDDPATRVPIRVCEAVTARAHELTREPALALYYGMAMRLSSHGFLGFAAMTAATVGEALALAVQFIATRTSAIGLALYVEGDRASLVIEERAPLGGLREFAVLSLMVGLSHMGHEATGHPPDGTGECAFPRPAYITTLGLDHRLSFERPVHRLVFASSALARPLASADLVAMRLARVQLERELATAIESAGLPGRIRAAIASHGTATLDDIARQLRMSPRTLKRRLADHGTAFSALRDEVRLHRALLLLDDRALDIGDVAARLGYSELPNFTRAFRKWTGMTPLAYRSRAEDRAAAAPHRQRG